MANKQYISIIRLLEHCGIAANGDFNLPRAKKQLRAEFGISSSGFIEVDGYSYSRNDVFDELDHPDFSQRLVFHKQIWERTQMLNLLENSVPDFATLGEGFKPLWSNRKFDKFFSPYFQGPFNYISRTLLAGRHFSEMSNLLAYHDFLLPAEREEAFRPIRVFLEENERLLRNTNGGNYKVMQPKIGQWIHKDWHAFFNALPAEFDDAKNNIVTQLVNIGVGIQRTFRRDCRKISGQLILLDDTPESLRQIIVSNHVIYGKSRYAFKGRPGFWLIWVIIALFRLVNADSCNDHEVKYNLQPYNLQDTSLFKVLRDSGFKTNHDTTQFKLKYNQ